MRRLLIATFVLLMLLPAVTALAGDNAHDLLIDACRDENVDGTYSQATYKRALGQLPADSDQYTACRDVINRARLAALNNRRARGGGGGAGGGGGGGGNTSAPSGGNGGGGNSSTSGTTSGASGSTTPVAPTAAEQKAVKKAISTGSSPVRVGGQLVQPGAVGSLASANRRIPTSLLALLIALAACAVLGAGALGWNRVIARRAH
jgi:hypothetical protein